MNVKLISYTKSVTDNSSLLDIVAYCARVSNPENQNNTTTSEKLVRYLIKNNHWSPLEMVNICIEIESTRDIIRQILRHRSFSFQEFSQRYAIVTETLNEPREARLQDKKNRQNSIVTTDEELIDAWSKLQQNVTNTATEAYKWALNNGIAKEQARIVLPEGLTISKIYMNGTVRSWCHYIHLRSGNGTQLEHRKIAIACAEVIKTVFPMITDFITTE